MERVLLDTEQILVWSSLLSLLPRQPAARLRTGLHSGSGPAALFFIFTNPIQSQSRSAAHRMSSSYSTCSESRGIRAITLAAAVFRRPRPLVKSETRITTWGEKAKCDASERGTVFTSPNYR